MEKLISFQSWLRSRFLDGTDENFENDDDIEVKVIDWFECMNSEEIFSLANKYGMEIIDHVIKTMKGK